MTQMWLTKFRSPYPKRLHIKFGFDRASGFGEEDDLNCLRRTDDGPDAVTGGKLINRAAVEKTIGKNIIELQYCTGIIRVGGKNKNKIKKLGREGR